MIERGAYRHATQSAWTEVNRKVKMAELARLCHLADWPVGIVRSPRDWLKESMTSQRMPFDASNSNAVDKFSGRRWRWLAWILHGSFISQSFDSALLHVQLPIVPLFVFLLSVSCVCGRESLLLGRLAFLSRPLHPVELAQLLDYEW